MNTLFAKLQAAIAGEPDEVPKGYLTRSQWAKKWDVKDCRASELLSAGVKKGIVTVQKFRVRNGSGVFPVPHYKEV